jgi:hypothetical protein
MKLFKLFSFMLFLGFATWITILIKRGETPCKGSDSIEALYINSNGEVTDAIVNLLGLTGIRILEDSLEAGKNWPESRTHLKSRRLEDIVPAVQGKLDPSVTWFGSTKKERWEEDPEKPKLSVAQAMHIIEICLSSLRLGEKTYPTKTPKAILFLGATLPSVRFRLAYLNELYDTKKLSPKLLIYILTGERKLDKAVGEGRTNLMNPDNGIISFRKDWVAPEGLISDEGEMINLVFSQSHHTDIHGGNVITVYSQKGMGRRATTESTVIQWLKEHSPSGGHYLAISNQPYNFYQESVIRRVLLQAGRSDISVEVVGPRMIAKTESDEMIIGQAKNLLNNISRIL